MNPLDSYTLETPATRMPVAVEQTPPAMLLVVFEQDMDICAVVPNLVITAPTKNVGRFEEHP